MHHPFEKWLNVFGHKNMLKKLPSKQIVKKSNRTLHEFLRGPSNLFDLSESKKGTLICKSVLARAGFQLVTDER